MNRLIVPNEVPESLRGYFVFYVAKSDKIDRAMNWRVKLYHTYKLILAEFRLLFHHQGDTHTVGDHFDNVFRAVTQIVDCRNKASLLASFHT